MAQERLQKLKYAKTLKDIPKYSEDDFVCPICLSEINIDDDKITNGTYKGMNNCVICENGHRMHYSCFSEIKKNDYYEPLKCPICRSPDIRRCKSVNGYSYVERSGGKKRKTLRRNRNKRHRTQKRKIPRFNLLQ